MWMMTWTALMVKMSRRGPRSMYIASSLNLDSFCNIHSLVHDAHKMLFRLSLNLCFFQFGIAVTEMQLQVCAFTVVLLVFRRWQKQTVGVLDNSSIEGQKFSYKMFVFPQCLSLCVRNCMPFLYYSVYKGINCNIMLKKGSFLYFHYLKELKCV